jgi:hypothetical protein
MRFALAALALLAGSAAPALAQDGAALAGGYQAEQMEVGAFLLLAPDGRFRYVLDYGVASESSEGRWTADHGSVRLVTEPKVKPPRFVVVKDEPAPKGELSVALVDPGFDWGQPFEVALAFAGGAASQTRAAGNDGVITLDAGTQPISVLPIMPVYEVKQAPYALSPETGHRVLFRFEPNDLGKADFQGEQLRIDGTTLILNRYDTEIRLNRVDDPTG